MKIQLFFIISILKIYIYAIERDPVYRCHDNPYRDEQCLTHEKLGDVDFYWIRKCKGAKVCVKLPYYGNMTGVCSIKVRSHYDGETCQKNNKCTSGICNNNKCKGFDDGHRCQPGLGQCKKGKVCRLINKEDTFHVCSDPIEGGKECEGLIKYNTEDNDYFNNSDKSYYLPENNICELGYVCSNIHCTQIHSIENGNSSTNPLACKSGAIFNHICIKNVCYLRFFQERQHLVFSGVRDISAHKENILHASVCRAVGYERCSCGGNGGFTSGFRRK